ncbi:DUF6087 family protein [Streptomyces sp. SID3343]|uniref:DUF6087 family protein n=1 Tax=Streptomyces sp. SID3343 TaxID=2690260 RepID=UPI0013680DD7|nr:hypothetical protein [Streptomyces sp. SID3343]
MDDEPLEQWLERRDARREESRGRRKAVPLGEGPWRAEHVNPRAPRLIVEWDGYAWQAVTVADDLAQARKILYPGAQAAAIPPPPQPGAPGPGPGRGRHRRPTSQG